MTSTVRKRSMGSGSGSASATTAGPTKRVRLPDHPGSSSSTSSRPRLGRLGFPAHHASDDSRTIALRRGKGSRGLSGIGSFVADDDDPDASGAGSSQPFTQKIFTSGQNPDADARSSLPSSFIPDSTFRTTPSADTAGLLTRNALSSSEAPPEPSRDPVPETLSKYERKLKKFVGHWHASLLKKGIPERLVHELAKQCIQTGDEEDDSGTDSQRNASHDAKKPPLPPLPGSLSRGTRLFQTSTQAFNNHQDGNKDGNIPWRSSANPRLVQAPQTDDEPVVVRLGAAAGGRARKQGLGGDDEPSTLVEALRAKSRRKNRGEEGDDAFDSLAVARRLQKRDFDGKLSSHDIRVIGMAVLHEVFGGRGQKRLADALTHLYGHHPRRYLADLDRNAGKVADDIRRGGPATLSSFTLRWAQAVQHDSPNMSTIDDIRLADMKVSLVREWDRWSSPAASRSRSRSDGDIEDFLAKNGIGANAGSALSTRIAKYLSRKLGFPERTLAKKIYAWRPLTVMTDIFGDGIYVFVSRSLFTCYNKIRPTDDVRKEDKFRAMALAVADELPDLLEICKASYTHVVQPILQSRVPESSNIQHLSRDMRVPGVQMATDGNLYSLRRTPIPQLLGISLSPRGFVEELGNVAGGDSDDDAEITLVRQRSTPYRHYIDGKDSDSNDDNINYDGSGGGDEDEDYNV
ncbi:hypothetical protein FAUST_11724 [Fusarium austroamericanum]|uniref:Uncharacterized protein n=1 Tax=Fusarium austroamericanum TaxID=282268 RepID=A0AAN6BUJ9_FUSAU|nr:hypothetical protein FAUST_11724 [Fusarium austroamericanum]